MKTLIKISLFGIMLLFSGCLTPYSNEFMCKPSIIGKCTSNIVDTYKETINNIDKQKELKNENSN
ncbi:MAG: hypothetical protein WC141_09250 [Arcobacteraceae bacterium]